LAGPELTAADIVAYPGLKLLLRASRHPEAAPLALCLDGFETRFPGIAAWMQRVEQLPGFEKTIRRIGGRLREPGSPGVKGAVSRMIQFITLSRSAALPNGASEADCGEII